MNTRIFILLAVSLCVMADASASPVISVQTHCLAPEMSAQAIAITVQGADMVTGFNLLAQIGDGMGANPEPVFDAVDFTGGMWDVHANTIMGQGVIDGYEQYAQASVIFSEVGAEVVASGVAVILLVDTTGFSGGSFDLMLSATDIGKDSDFVVSGGGSLAPSITNGTIIISQRLVSGDADGDGDVNGSDVDIFMRQLGMADPNGTLAADFNNDGRVNLKDFIILRDNFGLPHSASGQFVAMTTPEPSAAIALLLGWLSLVRRQRRRESR